MAESLEEFFEKREDEFIKHFVKCLQEETDPAGSYSHKEPSYPRESLKEFLRRKKREMEEQLKEEPYPADSQLPPNKFGGLRWR